MLIDGDSVGDKDGVFVGLTVGEDVGATEGDPMQFPAQYNWTTSINSIFAHVEFSHLESIPNLFIISSSKAYSIEQLSKGLELFNSSQNMVTP